jgi:hypothetical protein
MGNTVLQEASKKNSARRRRSRWKRVVRAMAAVVIFCTVYALVLPAVTMGDDPICGLEPHIHDDGCWRTVSVTAACPAAGETVLHTHDEGCYDEFGTLWCPLPERTAHVHTDECYSEVEVTSMVATSYPHSHTDECLGQVKGELLCTTAEVEGHAHGEGCYEHQRGELT